MITTEPSVWIEFFGRLHVMVLHAPIGLLVGLAILEFGAWLRHRVESPAGTLLLAWLTALSAALAAGTGYVLGSAEEDRSRTLATHQALGIAVAASCLLMAILRSAARGNARPYRMALLLTLALLIPAGHYGATMTHGASFLTEPFARAGRAQGTTVAEKPGSPPAVLSPSGETQPAAAQPAAAGQAREDLFAARVAPVLAERCGTCHGESLQKGGLALHTPEAIAAGGKRGPILAPGKPAESEIVRRLRLPVDDLDHMPPDGKPQLTEEQILTIEKWIAAGAAFGPAPATASLAADAPAQAEAAPPSQVAPPTEAPPAGAEAAEVRHTAAPPDPAALAALKESLVHVEAVEAGSNLLRINFAAAAARTDDALAARLLGPVLAQLETLAISRCAVGDETAALLARAEHLRRLDLRGTRVTDQGVAALAHLKNLEELVLAQTRLTDAAAESLSAMPALKRLYVWGSDLTKEAVARLREQRPGLYIDAGDFTDAAAEEVEPDLKLTSDAPPPGAASATAVSLAPVNTTCPVSGSPVDPRYAIVHKNRIIGFCCPKCPTQFWADPAKFEPKLPPAPAEPVQVAGD